MAGGAFRGVCCAAIVLVATMVAGLSPLPAAASGDRWGIPVRLGSEGLQEFNPDVAVDANGNAVVVWTRSEGNLSTVWADSFWRDKGWAPAEQIAGPIAMPVFTTSDLSPRVAIGSSGTPVAVWATNESVWATYRYGSWWAPASPISGGPGVAGGLWHIDAPKVHMDAMDRALVVWLELYDNASLDDVWAAWFIPGAGWGLPNRVSAGGGPTGLADVALSPLDKAVAVWHQAETVGSSLWSNSFTPGIGWGTAVRIDAGGGCPDQVRLAISADGHGFVVWEKWGAVAGGCWAGSSVALSAIAFTADGEWGQPVQGPQGWVPDVAVDGTGNALVVWRASYVDGGGVWASPFQIPGTWGNATQVAPDSAIFHYAEEPSEVPARLAVDGLGRALVVFNAAPPVFNDTVTLHDLPIASRWSLPGAGWSEPAIISPDGGSLPEVVTNPSGSAVIVWTKLNNTQSIYDWSGSIWASSYIMRLDTTPPALHLVSPDDGLTVSVPTVLVSGWTEPGASLTVNGIQVPVPANGSFSVELALSEGRNAVEATATDEAGNVAQATANVTYVNSVPQLVQEARDLQNALYVLIVLTAALSFLMVFSLWRRGFVPVRRGRSRAPAGDPSPSARPPYVEGEEAAKPTNPSVMAVSRPTPGPQASRSPPPASIRLTARERVLLHLLRYARYSDALEVPRDVVQEGIAGAAWIDQRHFSQYVGPLVRDGLVRERTAHVRNGHQRRRVYDLTETGRRVARRLEARAKSEMVRVWDGEHIWEIRLGDVLDKVGGKASILDVVRQMAEAGVVDFAALTAGENDAVPDAEGEPPANS